MGLPAHGVAPELVAPELVAPGVSWRAPHAFIEGTWVDEALDE
jgi:hypothetical protein